MLKLDFNLPVDDRPFNVLCLGAHCDDIEIGCGGAMLKLIQTLPQVHVRWVVFSSTPERAAEARTAADAFLDGAITKTVEIFDHKDGFFPYDGANIKRRFESFKDCETPDLIFTHYRIDAHQDHRTLCELTWNTYRNHMILEYEIPKYDGDLGSPNAFVQLGEAMCRRKADIIRESFVSQQTKQWFTNDTLFALMRLRGVECASPTKYAEAFYCRKSVLL